MSPSTNVTRAQKTPPKITNGILVLGLATWIWSLSYAPMLVFDDAFIFFRYANNIVGHGRLAWNLTENGTDGFTSLGYLLYLCAFRSILPGDVVRAAWVACTSASVLCLLTSFLWCRRHLVKTGGGEPSDIIAMASCILLIASSPLWAYWNHTCMDAVFFSWIVLLASWATVRLFSCERSSRLQVMGVAVALFMLAITRPEGLLVVAVLIVLALGRLAWSRKFGFRVPASCSWALVVSLALTSVYVVWHVLAYGRLFPNPVYVKSLHFTWAEAMRGGRYLLEGPGAGLVPISFRDNQIWAASTNSLGRAIAPKMLHWPYPAIVILPVACWILSLWSRVWRSPEAASVLRAYFLVGLGLLGISVLAGGDALYNGWRFVAPLIPTIWVGVFLCIRNLAHVWIRRVLLVAVTLLAVHAFLGSFTRPALCRETGLACGMKAVASWPITVASYHWDTSDASQDQEVAAALKAAFPADTTIGEADFLRIGVHLENPLLDLSGLVNERIVDFRSQRGATRSRLGWAMMFQPEVFFYGYRFVSPHDLSRYPTDAPIVSFILYPWPEFRPNELGEFMKMYVSAAVQLEDGRFFNFFVHRNALHKLRAKHELRIQSMTP